MIALLRKAVDLGVTFFDTAEVYGPLLVANVADPNAFRSGRNFSAWIGLVPKQHSSGGKNRLSSISKQGDRYQLRVILIIGRSTYRQLRSDTPTMTRRFARQSL